ncbi:MAG: hypothetical protein PHI36_09375, partial [Bacteroidales bacterium]|nr:hypothetical protein [Bacteroidales bacterium]
MFKKIIIKRFFVVFLLILPIFAISQDKLENYDKSNAQNNIKQISALNQIKWEKGGIYEGFSPKDEILEKRTQNTKHFRKDNGDFVAQIGGNYHYQDENATWQDIDFTITKT